HAGRPGARHRGDLHGVAHEIDPGADEECTQSHFDPRRGADAAAFDARDIAALDAEVVVHDQEPVHALGLCTEELHALPLGKCRQRRMSRSADEIDCTIAQRRVGLVDRKYELDFDVHPLLLEEAELRGGDRWKIGVGNHVGYGEFHGASPGSWPDLLIAVPPASWPGLSWPPRLF